MTATVVHLDTTRRRQARSVSTRDAVTQAVMETFKAWPVPSVAHGIAAAQATLTAGGSFIEAMDAAGKSIQLHARCHHPQSEALRNAERMALVYQRRERMVAGFLELIDRWLRVRLAGRPECDITAALERAHRVLDGGGTPCTAMHHAIGDEPAGPTAC